MREIPEEGARFIVGGLQILSDESPYKKEAHVAETCRIPSRPSISPHKGLVRTAEETVVALPHAGSEFSNFFQDVL